MIRLTNVCKDYPTRGGMRRVLNNISFTMGPGEKVGILGPNGAGKSTLVRLVSGAEPASAGTIERTMSVSWPLAFSGGFHAALTGADNVRFICRIYGVDYEPRFEFVKDFAELGIYLHEPVATYSSGMKSRLAFAISMTIDFDCYLIDEVQAVGDERFRERCREELFNKRRDKAKLIVSHSHTYLQESCERFLLLKNGTIEEYDRFEDAFFDYKTMIGEAFESKEDMIRRLEKQAMKRAAAKEKAARKRAVGA